MAAQNIDVNTIFVDIHKNFNNGDYEKSVRLCDKILNKFPAHNKAFQCKLVCLINLDKFQNTISLINENAQFKEEFQFERAYCHYRLNQTREALSTLRAIAKPDQRCLELTGQILYKLEQYQESMEIYADLVDAIKDDYVNERVCNFLAVATMLGRSKDFSVPGNIAARIRTMSAAESTCTYEQLYNISAWLIAGGDLPAATACLQEAESKIKSLLNDPDFAGDTSLKGALCAVQTQLAYVMQVSGNQDSALKLYNEVFKQRPDDVAIQAVVSNNIVTIHKAQDVFDSRKKLKVATSEAARLKLTTEQYAAIMYNQALFFLLTGQLDQVNETVASAEKRFSPALLNEEHWVLLRSTSLAKEKKLDEAVKMLQSAPKTLRIQMALAQFLFEKGPANEVTGVLHGLVKENDYAAGLVGCLTSLLEKQNRLQDATAILRDAAVFHKKRSNDALCQSLLRAAANLNQRHSKLDVAAEFFEQLRRDFLPNDRTILAQLISIYLRTDPNKAEKIGQSLPSLDEAALTVDVGALEQSIVGGGKILKSKQPAAASSVPTKVTSDTAKTAQQAAAAPAKKNKKKKKKPVIKNFIPNFVPDPERWLPKWQRSTYRGPKKRAAQKSADIGKGTQGGSADADTEHSLGTGGTMPQQQQQQQRPATAPQGRQKQQRRKK